MRVPREHASYQNVCQDLWNLIRCMKLVRYETSSCTGSNFTDGTTPKIRILTTVEFMILQRALHISRIFLPDIGHQSRFHLQSLTIKVAEMLYVADEFDSALSRWFSCFITQTPGMEGDHAGVFWPSQSLSLSFLSFIAFFSHSSRSLLIVFSKSSLCLLEVFSKPSRSLLEVFSQPSVILLEIFSQS